MQDAQAAHDQQVVFNILELIQRIGNYLNPSDLFACVQVSHYWCNSLISLLWETIDDSELSWPRIVRQLEEDAQEDNNSYIRLAFVKFGSHIRHLRLHSRTTLDAVCIGNHCCNLRSLHIGHIRHSHIQQPEHYWMTDLDSEEQDDMITLRWDLAMEGLTPSLFPTRKEPMGRTLAQQEQDWSTSKHFWTFLRNNDQLQSLCLHTSLNEFMEDVSMPYLVDTLSSLKDLAVLESNYVAIGLEHVFSRFLALVKYSTSFSPSGSGRTLIQPSQQLREARFLGVCTCREVLRILSHAPNLESLSVGGVSDLGLVTPTEAGMIMDNTPSRVTSLKLGMRGHALDIALDQVFAWMPHLTTFTTIHLLPSIAETLSSFCTNLETVHAPYNRSIYAELSHPVQLGTLAIGLLLKNCPTLKKFDGIRHVLSGEIWEEPWVCQGLEFLRCQVKGVQRLSYQDQERYDVIAARTGDVILSEEESRLVLLHTISLEQQRKIYKKLATQTKLRVLDLGGEYRRLHRRLQMSDEEYLGVNGPFSGTLELTLEAGLGQLRTLRDLQVFGFEGVDHRIGQAELEWMAREWTRLEEMRGLHDNFPARIGYEHRKTGLKKRFEVLRPDVKHQGPRGARTEDQQLQIEGLISAVLALGPSASPSPSDLQDRFHLGV
ncbi:hypothetical protein BGZ96_010876 [Linnemannia gamsii]|uniref:F-box domain-containing protein n=1 Tax=Linnemannia gamsii TaxID=64522 RepID=A0ABQ7JV66_9FUNG|nr:hypothetical protein BGZ96_010876 [Linnemannia gamsii]